ncbi:pilus assembly protein PilB [Marinobacter salicampi]|uniref:pilus assembly protein PilB n=1 Tax=Marinobacter salicampi TaxID=435907 RepID=UPI00140C6E19|nr:pilus assembly protein PilB [Marinobacter salicampi]
MKISQNHQEKSRLGRLLVTRGYVSETQLEQGLSLQRETGQRLGEALVQAGWISERELYRVLKHQTRYRHAVALVAMVSLPLQPLVSFASTASSGHENIPSAGELYGTGSRLQPMNDFELAQASAQGAEQFLSRIGNVALMASTDREELEAGNRDADALKGLSLAAYSFMPVLGFLDYDVQVTGVHYSDARPRFRLVETGGLEFALPERIEQIRLDNISVAGSPGPSMGNVSLHNIQFSSQSRMTIHVR